MANYEAMNLQINNMAADITSLKQKLQEKDEVDASKNQVYQDQVSTQKDTLLILEKRLDTNEKHVQLLMTTDEDLKKDVGVLDGKNKDLSQKIEELEAADTFLREANQEVMKKAQNIEDEEKKLSMKLVVVDDSVNEVKVEVKSRHEDVQKMVTDLKEEDEALWKKIEELGEEFGKIDVRIEDVKRNGSEHAKGQTDKLELAIGGLSEKLKQLEGISNENAEVINQFTINHLTFEEKIDNSFGDVREVNNEQDAKLGKLQKMVEEARDHSGKIEVIVQDELRPLFGEVKDNVTVVQGEVKKIDLIMEKEEALEKALQGIREDVGKLNRDVEDTEKDLESKTNDINIRIDELAGLDKENGENHRNAIERLEQELLKQAEDAEKARRELLDILERLKQMQGEITQNYHGVGEAKDRALECEAKVQGISPVVSGHTEDIEDLRKRVEGNVGSIGKNIMDIHELMTNLDGIRAEHQNVFIRIDSLDGNSADIRKKADSLEDGLRSEIERLNSLEGRFDNDLKEKFLDLDDKNKNNLEQIIALQEMNYNNVQKITLVESMRDQIGRLEDEKQKSEAKIQLDLEEKDKTNMTKIADLQGLLDTKIMDMNAKLGEHGEDLGQLKQDVKKAKEDIGDHDNKLKGHEQELQDLKPQVQQNKDDIEALKNLRPEVDNLREDLNAIKLAINTRIDKLDDEARNSSENQGKVNGKVRDDLVEIENRIDALKDKFGDDFKQMDDKLRLEIMVKLKEDMDTIRDQDDNQFKELKDLVDSKIGEINKSLEKNDNHVENLRELNTNLLAEIKANVQEQMDKQAKVTDDIKDNNTKEIENIKLEISVKFKEFEDLKSGDVDDLKVPYNNSFIFDSYQNCGKMNVAPLIFGIFFPAERERTHEEGA